jgi:uncharacterized protein (TIGR02271 family)
VAHSYEHLGPNLTRLSEFSGYTIEEGDPDPRGYTVVSPDGRDIGEVEDLIVDTSALKVRYLVVELEDDAIPGGEDDDILLAADDIDVHTDSRRVVARNFSAAAPLYDRSTTTDRAFASDTDRTSDHDRTLTRTEEELHIGKREVSRGEVRVGKHVETERVSEPVTRRREEVVVERRPVEAGARAHADISDDEIRVPLVEEEVIVEKRPVVKEELVVGKRVVEERDTVETDVRREEFDIDEDARVSSRTRGKGDDR